MCCDEFFEKIKVVINCVTRLYQTKLNCFDFKTSFGPNNSRKFGFESFWWAMFENRYLMIGLYYRLKYACFEGINFEVFDVCCDEFFEKIKVVINCVTRLYQTKLNCFDFKISFGPNNSRKFGFESFWRTMFENRYLMLGLYYQVICVFRRHQSWGARGVLWWIFWKNKSSY